MGDFSLFSRAMDGSGKVVRTVVERCNVSRCFLLNLACWHRAKYGRRTALWCRTQRISVQMDLSKGTLRSQFHFEIYTYNNMYFLYVCNVCMYGWMDGWMYVRTYVRTYVRMDGWMYGCMYVCMYIYILIHVFIIHIYNNNICSIHVSIIYMYIYM